MNGTILVVDDEKEIADLIEVYLTNDGYTVRKFYNGTDALKYLETSEPDLAILEVVARVKTQLRRCRNYNNPLPQEQKNEYDIRGLYINRDSHKCTLYGKEVTLTPLEFSVLWYLCDNQGRVVPSEELFEAVWGEKYLNSNNTVMAHIGRLREKLHEPARSPKFIKTVWGVGYTIE